MGNRKYEIELVYFGPGMHHETMVGLLTGLQLDEIKAACPKNDSWYTRTYIEVFHKLGFSTNPRFKKFDPETQYPVIMRCKEVGKENGHWYGWIYYDGWVYSSYCTVETFDEWIEYYGKDYRVTSMLQVWI